MRETDPSRPLPGQALLPGIEPDVPAAPARLRCAWLSGRLAALLGRSLADCPYPPRRSGRLAPSLARSRHPRRYWRDGFESVSIFPRAVRSLLILACSATKRDEPGPAWDVYDGQVYRVLKSRFRAFPRWDERIEVLIVSARYGVIRASEAIEPYDERVSRDRGESARIGERWASQLESALGPATFRDARIDLGRDYLECLPDLADRLGRRVAGPIEFATGGIGSRTSETARWAVDRLERR